MLGISLAVLVLLFCRISFGSTIQIEVSGFSTERGLAVVALFDEASWGIPIDVSKARHVVMSPIFHSRMYTELSGVAHGMYVVVVFHDADNDGRLDSDEETALSRSPGCTVDCFDFEALAVMNKTLVTSVVLAVTGDRGELAQPETDDPDPASLLLNSLLPMEMEALCSSFL